MKHILSLCLCLFLLSSCAAQSRSILKKNTDGSTTLLYNTTVENSIYLSANGNMGIGKKEPTDKLEVNGQIHARAVKVDLNKWADTVFKKEYDLKRLGEIEAYIAKHGHLPEIPAAATVLEEGINLGEMNRLLLQKIEELTLHLIEKEKQLERLDAKISALQNDVAQLKTED